MTEKECRICFESEEDSEFIHPCLCDGTSKWVHTDCLDKWRQINLNRPGNKKCMECQYKYRIIKTDEEETFIHYYIQNNFICYFLFVLLFSYPVSMLIWLFDEYNNYASLNMVTLYNDNFTKLLINKINEFPMNKGFYYQSLAITIYSNCFFGLFLILSLFKIHRKKLYFSMIWKKYIFGVLLINNMFYNFGIFIMMDLIDSYFIVNSALTAYNMFLTVYLIRSSNKKLLKMNTRYNTEEVLNFIRDNEMTSLNIVLDPIDRI